MIGYSLVRDLIYELNISIEIPCIYCGEPTNCSCGCCHSPECNTKRGTRFNNSFFKLNRENAI